MIEFRGKCCAVAAAIFIDNDDVLMELIDMIYEIVAEGECECGEEEEEEVGDGEMREGIMERRN
jgi:hypothetical protein